jgi:hypothetical protein
MKSKIKKIYYNKLIAWFTLFLVILIFTFIIVVNYFEDKKISPLLLTILAIILFSIVIFTFLITYRGIPIMIIK